MTLTIKPEFAYIYPKIRDCKLQFVSASFVPGSGVWVILTLGQDGEFHSVKRDHVKMVTKLEIALE